MKQVRLVQVGIGTVGGRVLELVAERRGFWRNSLGLEIEVSAVVTSCGALAADGPGFSDTDLRAVAAGRRSGLSLSSVADNLQVKPITIDELDLAQSKTILLDAASGTRSSSLAAQVLSAGGTVVYSNKAPLSQDASVAVAEQLWSAARSGEVRYETTCGAGLPVISTLRSLLDTGDTVLGITGCLSGTLGAIFSDIAAGKSFSDAISAAKAAGYTEPDPRDDLSGLDVARKALILARTIGRSVDLSDIAIESLVPANLADCSVATFMERIAEQNRAMGQRQDAAIQAGNALKYVATVPANGPIKVGIEQVPTSTVLGALQGPENIISIRTERYDRYPLTISGPGAGADVTAAGMIADMLELAKARA